MESSRPSYREYQESRLKAFFAMSEDFFGDLPHFAERDRLVYILWNRSDRPAQFQLDGVETTLAPDQMMSLTFLHHLVPTTGNPPITGWAFNRAFYCILDHDEEVSCNGIIFFGTQSVPIISLDMDHHRKMDLLYQVFEDELQTRDNIQGEMLQMLLKRLIILITRLAKEQATLHTFSPNQVDLIRQYNLLVDQHFREKRQVKDYADLLHRSPKTLSNLFAQYNQETPLQVIHNRIMLEAKRLLIGTDFTAKEIGYELGFEDSAHFSKMFKKTYGLSPSAFRNQTFSASGEK
ncbi:helix-turn-helix domain-containing protein [Pontibacter sp. G13]|uniref:AraC family transcriptional regulator n=1 Tax=Pontibacter sp. G13 TaxID=3074898 RepID=UPI00288AC62A|nr:helix-turn-helix domain-containing protein [Pontibacter sp. G13]WNJ17004.1 helix-turn-helix domain-containing protein [Pontibacter sp. G13]